MPRINPFRPNAPVAPGMFAGRLQQVRQLEEALLQTRSGHPKSFMLTGERGIGKTSLLRFFRWVAQGHIEVNNERLKFLVVDIDLNADSTDLGLISRVNLALRNELAKEEPGRAFLSTAWEFIQRIEAQGLRIRDHGDAPNPETLHDAFAYSLSSTIQRITQRDAPNLFGAQYDGLALLVDEADNAPRSLRLGSFLKLLAERVERNGCERMMIGLAGRPALREMLRESHASSLRIFDELLLGTLSAAEVNSVIDRALTVANQKNAEETHIDIPARTALVQLSEGYPHFIQQFGYSAFSADSDFTIDKTDVYSGAFGQFGAMEKIGDRYYRNDFYNKIQKDSYRQVLRIMADSGTEWVSKQAIRSRFKGKATTLDNAINALRERNIIISKEGERGKYRLQHRGFALWIKLYTTDERELQSRLDDAMNGKDASGKPPAT